MRMMMMMMMKSDLPMGVVGIVSCFHFHSKYKVVPNENVIFESFVVVVVLFLIFSRNFFLCMI